MDDAKHPSNPLPCGCRAVLPDDYGVPRPQMPVIYVVHCPLHAAAPALLAACNLYADAEAEWEGDENDSTLADWLDKLGVSDSVAAALAKTE